ncbi:hypothetical protein M407DRAFT_18120 [Tulasnella calospora MUT 4182]|uniref:Uncharacterized protein n=1 Tax=Tulasnella calospora MUT 4182 TaxID=1051891 RepID=A0A0C3QW00_9AGAM|nr:hypothetical protein M407DRAFT_18120 [Tulasnella calospora MUT 4182]
MKPIEEVPYYTGALFGPAAGGVSTDDIVALFSFPWIMDVQTQGGSVDGGGLAGGVDTQVDDASRVFCVPANGRLGAQADDSRVSGNSETIVCSDGSLMGLDAGGWATYSGGTVDGGGAEGVACARAAGAAAARSAALWAGLS